MSRFARERKVYYLEEPIFDSSVPAMQAHECPLSGVTVLTPHLPAGSERQHRLLIQNLVERYAHSARIDNPIVWFYTPMALDLLPETVTPSMVIYDCMDELSMFKGAPVELLTLEDRLLKAADLVFTGGVSIFEVKRNLHKRVHAFPSGVDTHHFMQARACNRSFAEHANIPGPRLGFAGVIDERMNLELVEEMAVKRPEWQIVMIGPTAKIDPAALPRQKNIHWLGIKDYSDLPHYFGGWDVALMPFAMNDATRFISPTKTPEYLSAGLPVVSTPIRDVVRPYGEIGLVRIAETADQFIEAAEQAMLTGMGLKWRERADHFLGSLSWDSVWSGMRSLIEEPAEQTQALGALRPLTRETANRV